MKMEIQKLVLFILKLLHYANGEFLQLPTDIFDMGRAIRNITRSTMTKCYMECRKDISFVSIGLTKTVDQNLYICHLLKPEEHNKIVLFQNAPLLLANSKLIGRIPTWNEEYQVQFYFKIDPSKMMKGAWYCVLHFTIGGDAKNYGDRVPSVVIKTHEKGGDIMIMSAVSGDPTFHMKLYKDYDYFNNWVHIDISQFLKECSRKYMFTIKIDGKVHVHVENKDVRKFDNIKIYAGSPWYKAQGEIKSLRIGGGEVTQIQSTNLLSAIRS